jgi:hypothetical protein
VRNGANKNYNYGPKRQSRRTLWNRAKERLSVPVDKALVLYLSGRDDEDRQVALSKGFKDHNLIAVDDSREIVDSLRRDGKLAIHGDIWDVISHWGGERIDVFYPDLCCGLERSVIAIARTLFIHRCLRNSVVIFNLQRGREKQFKDYAAKLPKHRGAYRDVALAGATGKLLVNGEPWGPGFVEDEAALSFWSDEKTKPSFDSYASDRGNLIMDSAVWVNRTIWDLFDVIALAIAMNGGDPIRLIASAHLRSLAALVSEDINLKRQIAAVKAHRTRILQQH